MTDKPTKIKPWTEVGIKGTPGNSPGYVCVYFRDLHPEYRERLEDSEEYDVLVEMLRRRFPQNPDGSFPDYKIEDVLRENEQCKARLEAAEELAVALRDYGDHTIGFISGSRRVRRRYDALARWEELKP